MAGGRRKNWLSTLRQGVTTDRLMLRLLDVRDHEAWAAGYRERGPASYPYDSGPIEAGKLGRDAFEGWVEHHAEIAHKDQAYVVWAFVRDRPVIVGAADLATLARGDTQWANIGFSVHNQFQRQGYGLEIIRTAIALGLGALGYHRLEAAIRPDNAPAIKAVAAAGMEREGIRRRFWLDPDG